MCPMEVQDALGDWQTETHSQRIGIASLAHGVAQCCWRFSDMDEERSVSDLGFVDLRAVATQYLAHEVFDVGARSNRTLD